MRSRSRPVAALVCAVAFAMPADAHHSAAAYYDVSKTVRLTGVVERVEWRNPHVFLFVRAKGPDGRPRLWSLETQSPVALERLGFQRGDIKAGETITVDVMPALHTPDRGRIRALTHHGKTFVDTAIGGRGR